MSASMTASQTDTSFTRTGLPTHARLLALAIILVAYSLRIYHLGYQSFASDEGISILRSAQPFAEMLRNMPVEHMPGYFTFLHGWMLATGQSDFAIRYLSLLPGVFIVPLIARMGIDFGSRRAGLIASTLMATGAFQVWYSQEARMYSWLLVAGAFSTWCLWLLLTRPPTLSVWLGYVLSSTLSIYLHYFGFLAPLVHIIISVLWLITRRNIRAFRLWVLAGLAVFALYLPWITRSVQILGFDGWRAPADPSRIPWLLLKSYTVGETMPDIVSVWLPLFYLALIILGAIAWHWRRRDSGFFLVVAAISSVLLTWLLVIRQPDFHVRYTIFVSTPLIMLAAGGITSLDATWWFRTRSGEQTSAPTASVVQYAPWALTAFLVFTNGLALNHLYNDPSVHRPDYRSAAEHIQRNLAPGDIILVDGPNPDLVFNHYYSGDAPVGDMRSLEGLTDAEIAAALDTITTGANRAWELLYFKPPGAVQVWLATHGWAAAPTFHNDIRVQLVSLDPGDRVEIIQGNYFGDALELISSSFAAGPHHAGDLVPITTNWYTHEQTPEYKFSMRLEDDAGQVRAANDYVPQNWFAPTNVWFVDQPATDQYGLMLPDDLAPGSYHVTLRLYDPYSGSPVGTAAGIDVPIAEFQVMESAAVGE